MENKIIGMNSFLRRITAVFVAATLFIPTHQALSGGASEIPGQNLALQHAYAMQTLSLEAVLSPRRHTLRSPIYDKKLIVSALMALGIAAAALHGAQPTLEPLVPARPEWWPAWSNSTEQILFILSVIAAAESGFLLYRRLKPNRSWLLSIFWGMGGFVLGIVGYMIWNPGDSGPDLLARTAYHQLHIAEADTAATETLREITADLKKMEGRLYSSDEPLSAIMMFDWTPNQRNYFDGNFKLRE